MMTEELGMAWCKMNNSSQPYPMYLYTVIPYIELVQDEAMTDDRKVCKICGFIGANIKGLAFHISVTHGITTKEYYDKYLKGENEGKCIYCGKQTRFEVYKQLLEKFGEEEILYEKLKIPYSYLGEDHTYLVDFFIPGFRLAIEVKPKNSLIYNEKERTKLEVAKAYCRTNELQFVLITEDEKEHVLERLGGLKRTK